MKNSSFVRFYHSSDKIWKLGVILGKFYSLSVKAYLVESKSIKSLSDWFAVHWKILSNHLKLFVESTQRLLKKETPHFMRFSKLTDLIHQSPTFLPYRETSQLIWNAYPLNSFHLMRRQYTKKLNRRIYLKKNLQH